MMYRSTVSRRRTMLCKGTRRRQPKRGNSQIICNRSAVDLLPLHSESGDPTLDTLYVRVRRRSRTPRLDAVRSRKAVLRLPQATGGAALASRGNSGTDV